MTLFTYLIPFLVVLTVLVFVHEFGHYWVARRNGVRVETFSIGFGPELFGFNDRHGTRWKFSAVPLGGYVKMFGDADAASSPATTALDGMTEDQRSVSFHHKPVGQRAAIAAAGPIANFLFSIVALFFLFLIGGHPFPPAVVGDVSAGGAAAEAGIRAGDRITSIDGTAVDRFAELGVAVRGGSGKAVTLGVERGDEALSFALTPRQDTVPTADGGSATIWRLGIAADTGPYGVVEAARMSVSESWAIVSMTASALGQMVSGQRGTEDLGGPLRIAQMSGEVYQVGIVALLWFMAILSINLGLINLVPIPMLDGGHLLFCAIEAIRGRPLGARAQEYGFRLGLALVLTLMLFATWNDLVQLKVVAFFKGLVS
jgi:regulator of sigma E protease